MEHPRIDLAHEPDFSIGLLRIHPSTRELSRGDERVVIEPRVMQVLVALHRAGGAVVSKDDLAHSCWEGRVVGEDAINRVLSRLRKVSDGIGKGIFHVETVTRVGYRLAVEGDAAKMFAQTTRSGKVPAGPISRRTALAGAGTALVAAVGGLIWYNRRAPVPSELATLLDRAQAAMQYHTPEQTAAAVGLLREATRLYPEHAEGWGKLAIAYHQQGWSSPRSDSKAIMEYGESAAKRALELDPGNVDGAVFLTVPQEYYYKNWLQYDGACRTALQRFPKHFVAARTCAAFLFSVGRLKESLRATEYLIALPTPSPQIMAMHGQKLWAAGRIEEAATLLNSALSRWPRHQTVWFVCHRFYTYAGKPQAAEAMIADVNTRPLGVPEEYYQLLLAASQAVRTGYDEDITTALRLFASMAKGSPAVAEEAVIFASATGNLNIALDYLNSMYSIGPKNKTEGLGGHSGQLTYFLFLPPLAATRAETSFQDVIAATGLEDYWRKAKIKPDYLE